jgi:plastin-1
MAKHSYTTDERRSFAEHINRTLKEDQDLRTILPLNPESDALFTAVGDGVLLIKWLNKLKPGIIPDKVIQIHPRNRFERLQNLSAVLTAARELGFNIVNVGPEDIIDQKYHLVLGLIWQIVRVCETASLLSSVLTHLGPFHLFLLLFSLAHSELVILFFSLSCCPK